MSKLEQRIQNIISVFKDAPPDLVESGRSWYPRARNWCKLRADMYGVPIREVAAVVSALSPRNRWERNLIDADQVLNAWHSNRSYPYVQCATFSQNVLKAWQILDDHDTSLAETSPKTRAFLDCIAEQDSSSVVIDVWAYRVAEGDPDLKAKGFSEKEYQEYEDAYQGAAERLDVPVDEVQAVTWVAYRNRSAQVPPGQMRLL